MIRLKILLSVLKHRKYSLILILIPINCFHFDKWNRADKTLFGTVATLQIIDGLNTNYLLGESEQNYIHDTWSWKYGTQRPSSEHLWAVKAIETVGAYYIADALPSTYRKPFLFGIDAILIGCIKHNFDRSFIGFSINY